MVLQLFGGYCSSNSPILLRLGWVMGEIMIASYRERDADVSLYGRNIKEIE
jgi:hypothetical protein